MFLAYLLTNFVFVHILLTASKNSNWFTSYSLKDDNWLMIRLGLQLGCYPMGFWQTIVSIFIPSSNQEPLPSLQIDCVSRCSPQLPARPWSGTDCIVSRPSSVSTLFSRPQPWTTQEEDVRTAVHCPAPSCPAPSCSVYSMT